MGIVAIRCGICCGGGPEGLLDIPYPPCTEGIGNAVEAWEGPGKGKCAEGCGGEDECEYADACACVFARCGYPVPCAGGGWGSCEVGYVVGCWGG